MSALRPELIAKRPDDTLVADLKRLAEEIIADVDHGSDCTNALDKITKLIGPNDFDAEYFRTLHSHSSVDEFAEMAAIPSAVQVEDLSREELVDIVRRAKDVTNWDAEYYMALFDKNVPMPGASDLIFYPPETYTGEMNDYDPSPEEIVEMATAKSDAV